MESALVDGSDLVGMLIDWSKCFDKVPQGIALEFAERQAYTRACFNLSVAFTLSFAGGWSLQAM